MAKPPVAQPPSSRTRTSRRREKKVEKFLLLQTLSSLLPPLFPSNLDLLPLLAPLVPLEDLERVVARVERDLARDPGRPRHRERAPRDHEALVAVADLPGGADELVEPAGLRVAPVDAQDQPLGQPRRSSPAPTSSSRARRSSGRGPCRC